MILGFMSRLSGAFVAAFWGLHLGAILLASLVVSGASRMRLRDVFGGALGGYADMFGEMWACFGGIKSSFSEGSGPFCRFERRAQPWDSWDARKVFPQERVIASACASFNVFLEIEDRAAPSPAGQELSLV